MADEFVVIPKEQLLDLLGDLLDERIDAKLGPLLSQIVFQQKDAHKITGVAENTIRSMVKRGELDPLQADGSSLKFFKLVEVSGLKPRSKRS